MTDPAHHSLIEDTQGIAFGVCMAAVGIQILTHMGFVTGQTTGLAVLITYMTGLPFPAVYFAISLPFLWLGYRRMGPAFALKTFISVALLTVATTILPRWIAVRAYRTGLCGAAVRHAVRLFGAGRRAPRRQFRRTVDPALILQDRTGCGRLRAACLRCRAVRRGVAGAGPGALSTASSVPRCSTCSLR